jgi:hypothetical protein
MHTKIHLNDKALSLTVAECGDEVVNLIIRRKRDKVRSISEVRERVPDERYGRTC